MGWKCTLVSRSGARNITQKNKNTHKNTWGHTLPKPAHAHDRTKAHCNLLVGESPCLIRCLGHTATSLQNTPIVPAPSKALFIGPWLRWCEDTVWWPNPAHVHGQTNICDTQETHTHWSDTCGAHKITQRHGRHTQEHMGNTLWCPHQTHARGRTHTQNTVMSPKMTPTGNDALPTELDVTNGHIPPRYQLVDDVACWDMWERSGSVW